MCFENKIKKKEKKFKWRGSVTTILVSISVTYYFYAIRSHGHSLHAAPCRQPSTRAKNRAKALNGGGGFNRKEPKWHNWPQSEVKLLLTVKNEHAMNTMNATMTASFILKST